MIVKRLEKPVALRIYDALNARMTLTAAQQRERQNYQRGYEGEVQLGNYFEKLSFDHLVLQDLQLKENGVQVQIDALLLTGNAIHLYQVKNYSGSYDFQDDALHAQADFVVDPLAQTRKSKPLIYNLVRKWGYRFQVEECVIFINPNFYIYQLPRDKPFVFHHQLPHHFGQISQGVWIDESHKRLAQKLLERHLHDYRSYELPHYEYAQLKKGIYCPQCYSFAHTNTRQTRICTCGYKETVREAIRRTAEEFRLLFPERKMTTSVIYDWCGRESYKQRIQEVMQEHFTVYGKCGGTYYA